MYLFWDTCDLFLHTCSKLMLITWKDQGFYSKRDDDRMSICSIMSQLSMHSRPEWTWHLPEGIWLHFYQPVPGHIFIRTCFLVTCGHDYIFLCLKGPLVPYQNSKTCFPFQSTLLIPSSKDLALSILYWNYLFTFLSYLLSAL